MALPLALGAAVAWFMRVVVGFVVRKIWWALVGQIGLFIVVYMSKDLLVAIVEKVKEIIIKMNSGTMAGVFKIENIVWKSYDYLFTKIDDFWVYVDGQLDNLMDKINIEEFESYLSILKFAVWLDGLVAEIITSIADAIRPTIGFVITPLLTKITIIKDKVDATEVAIINVTATFNARLDGLFVAIAAAYDAFDTAITEISGIVGTLKNDVILHNQQLATNQGDLQKWLTTRLNLNSSGSFTPLTRDDAVQLVEDFGNHATVNQLDVSGYDIAWDDYRWINTHTRDDYLLSIDIPELGELCEDLTSIHTILSTLGDDVATAFHAKFPTILRGNLEDRIKPFLLIAATQILIAKKEQVQEVITAKRNEIDSEVTIKKETLKDKVEEIKQDIKDIEDAIIDKLPTTFKTSIEKAVDDINKAIVETGDEAIVNIDQFIPDVGDIDHIIEIFPKDIKANAEPNISDSETFTIQDIYRLLCNNFTRAERIALILILSSQDLLADTGELETWLEEFSEGNENKEDNENGEDNGLQTGNIHP